MDINTYRMRMHDKEYGDVNNNIKDGNQEKVYKDEDDWRCISTSSSATVLYDDDLITTNDILDLERMTEKRVEERRAKIERQFDEAYLKKNRHRKFIQANLEEIKRNDAILKRAYKLYFSPGLEDHPRLMRKTEELIERVERLPHLYCPHEREETTEVHVNRWLYKHTSNPEAELLGFTSREHYEPKRFIPTAEPRLSTSDTNIVLGKRKRKLDEDHVVCVVKSSSESRLVRDDGSYGNMVKRSRKR